MYHPFTLLVMKCPYHFLMISRQEKGAGLPWVVKIGVREQLFLILENMPLFIWRTFFSRGPSCYLAGHNKAELVAQSGYYDNKRKRQALYTSITTKPKVRSTG